MRTLNLDFLVEVRLDDKRLYMKCENKKSVDNCLKEGKIVIDNVAYYKPLVTLFFLGERKIYNYFDSYEEAKKFYDEMTPKIKNQIIQ